jgi:hypothetical protein
MSKPSVSRLADISKQSLDKGARFQDNFCVPWTTNTDEWWRHHPGWIVAFDLENETHSCFRKQKSNPERTIFLREVYKCQNYGNCNKAIRLSNQKMDFSMTGWTNYWHQVVQGLSLAQKKQLPVQLVDIGAEHEGLPCPIKGTLDCFFLTISSCHNNFTADSIFESKDGDDNNNLVLRNTLEYTWFLEYSVRPQSWLRKQVSDLVRQEMDQLSIKAVDLQLTSCVVFYLSDETAELKDYIHAAGQKIIADTTTILLVSDNPLMAKKMAQEGYPEYQWHVLGTDYMNSDGPLKSNLVALMSIFYWLQRYSCSHLVHGSDPNSFSDYLFWEMATSLNRPRSVVSASFSQEGQEAVPFKVPNRISLPKKNLFDTSFTPEVTTSSPVLFDTKPFVDVSVDDFLVYDDALEEYYLHESLPIHHLQTTLCLPWEVNGDRFWTHHPDFEAGMENDTHYCFERVRNSIKGRFFKQLYLIQFGPQPHSNDNQDHCSNLTVKRMWNSGWGADFMNIADGLAHALETGNPIQIDESEPWHYAIPKRTVDSSKPLKAACPKENMYCFLLNITSCSSSGRTRVEQDFFNDIQKFYFKDKKYRWYIEYIVRPQTWLRKRVYDFLQKPQVPVMQTPCTVMHVRRNDVVLHNDQARKFHPISEYINATTNVRPNILLLTDDHNALGEAKVYFPQFNWQAIDRPRFSGVGGWEHQIPSDDSIFEVVVLFAIFQLVRSCDQIILSYGKFSDYLYEEMKRDIYKPRNVELVNIDEEKTPK